MDSTMTPPAAASATPSTKLAARAQIGETVLVLLAPGVRRPLLVTGLGVVEVGRLHEVRREVRISGTLFCEPEDHLQTLIRAGSHGVAGDPAQFHGRPDRHQPFVYAEHLKEGPGIGEWQPRPTGLPARS